MIEEVLSCDPGASGGFAFFSHKGISVHQMPEDEEVTLAKLKEWTAFSAGHKKIAIIEMQSGYSSAERGAVAATRMFTFGNGYGFIRGALKMAGWEIVPVHPKTWQLALGVGGRKAHNTYSEWKNHLKAKAHRLYPGTKITLKTADALLILEWYMRSKNTLAPMASLFS